MDIYSSGSYLNDFEAEMAEMFGKEAALFFPTGTMAQQIALRIWCEQRQRFTVAMHPTAHLEWAEHSGYQFLHGIHRLQFDAPESLRNRILTVDDFESMGQLPGAMLLELPYRPLGGQLPSWDELVEMSQWARERGIPFHMDGARIWACRPHFNKSYAEIAALFDSLYISFYKDIGGISGAMLLGTKVFIEEARVWQIRHGGRIITHGPALVSAKLGLSRVLPQIDQWVARAQEIAEVMNSADGVSTNPNPPQSNMFQLFIRGETEVLLERHLTLAEETGTYLFRKLQPSSVPGIAQTEIHCRENSLRFDLEALPSFLEKLVAS
jgi:threonine aldolase